MQSKLESLMIGQNIEYEDEETRLEKKINYVHQRVLELYKKFGINIGPVPIVLADQVSLRELYKLEMYLLDSSFDDRYTRGMYCESEDVILLDEDLCRSRNIDVIEHVLVHEYAHRFYRAYMNRFENKYVRRNEKVWLKSQRFELPLLPGPVLEGEELAKARLEQVKKSIESLKKQKRTQLEKRRLEFDIYFEEMFAESTAIYLTGEIELGDHNWYIYSRLHQGVVLAKDREFFMKLERLLHELFFEKMFSYGFKKIAMVVPILYNDTRDLFEKRYLKLLDRPVICL